MELQTGTHCFPVSWSSKRQTSTSCHTCEAETVSLATCLRQQGIPVQELLVRLMGEDIHVHVMEDNTACISAITKGYSLALRYLKRTQRIDLGFLHEVLNSENYHLEKVDTKVHKGDFFTKPLSLPAFREGLERIGIVRT